MNVRTMIQARAWIERVNAPSSHAQVFGAVERSIADLIGQFAATPDLYLHESDLLSAFFHILQQHEALAARYTTRDGRRTGLVHREVPSFFAYAVGAWHAVPVLDLEACVGQSYYDVAVLNPAFVRGHDLELLAHRDPARVEALRALPDDERPLPMLVAANLKLIDQFTPQVVDELETDFYDLARAEPDALRRYLGVFCRHWDADGPMTHILRALERWAGAHTGVATVFVQAYRDDIGRVFGGRYLNVWSQTAPLPPLA